jgi:methyl-accepting chemotaxis protein
MAKSVESMRDGINQVQSGVSSAESARQKWSANKDSILAGNDQTLESLTALSQQLETLVPHLQTAKDTAAGAVLVAAIMAAIVGLIIFVPRIVSLL